MTSRYLAHITFTTGHVRRSPRAEVAEGITDILRPLLDRALRGEHAPVPGRPGYTITGGIHGRCCMITLWRIIPDTTGERIPEMHIGIAGHSRCGAELWRQMHALAGELRLPAVADSARPPVTPWCADLIGIGMALDMSAAEWTGDLSRCLAWTWLDHRK